MLDLKFRHLAIGIAVGAGIGAGGAYAYIKRITPAQQPVPVIPGPQPTDEASVFRVHEAFKYGVPQTETLRFYEGYVASFDSRTRNPKWVLEYITKDSLKGEGTRDLSNFYEDPGLEPRFRSKLDDYANSGYDRGHMAPAANHRANQKAMNDTFSLSNISPQVGAGFNRDYWARFEKFVKDTVKVSDGVYIVTGPLWLPQPDLLGTGKWEMRHPIIGKPPRLISVPTHYYKVVLAENTTGKHGSHQAAVGAFVMPNAPIDPQTPVTAFTVPLEALEAVSVILNCQSAKIVPWPGASRLGAKFFPAFINDRRRLALDGAAFDWQAEAKQQLRALDRTTLIQNQAAILPGPAAELAVIRSQLPAAAQASVLIQGLPKTVGGEGAVHLCDVVACRLPPANWWDNGNGRGNSSSGGGGGGRSLQRSGSSRGRRNVQEVAAVAEVAEVPDYEEKDTEHHVFERYASSCSSDSS